MPSRDASRPVSRDMLIAKLPLISYRRPSSVTHQQAAQNDTKDTMTRYVMPAVEEPAPGATHGHSASVHSAPVNQHSLGQYYQTGEYSDLKVVSYGFSRKVHKIIVCSESPVIKEKCNSLGLDQCLELYRYNADTIRRVLDFCYRRTYSDGEYPEAVPSFPLNMTAADVCNALEAPLAVASDEDRSEWKGLCSRCENSGDTVDEETYQREETVEDAVERTHEGTRDIQDEEGQDEYLPDRCEIDYSTDDDSESSDDEKSHVNIPFDPQGTSEIPYPPYEISLFANFDVYIAAKDLQIPALQLLARQRFAHTFRSHWSRFTHLTALIDDVYLRTDESDTLRALICKILASIYDSEYGKDSKAKIRELMTRNGEFAADMVDLVFRLQSEWADME